jgi:hypothetical protein
MLDNHPANKGREMMEARWESYGQLDSGASLHNSFARQRPLHAILLFTCSRFII